MTRILKHLILQREAEWRENHSSVRRNHFSYKKVIERKKGNGGDQFESRQGVLFQKLFQRERRKRYKLEKQGGGEDYDSKKGEQARAGRTVTKAESRDESKGARVSFSVRREKKGFV